MVCVWVGGFFMGWGLGEIKSCVCDKGVNNLLRTPQHKLNNIT